HDNEICQRAGSSGHTLYSQGFEALRTGQFGLNNEHDGKNADAMVRELCLPLEADGVFARVVRTGEPFIGAMPDTYWFAELLSRIGGFGHELTLFVLPLTCN